MYHKIILAGNLGGDPVMRYTPDGTPVTNFSIATTERWTGQDGEKKEKTIWWRVTVWRRLAEICNEYLRKGRQVLVEGRMNGDENGGPRVFVRKDGTPGASYEVTAVTVKFLGSKGDGGGESAPGGEYESNFSEGPESEDIPF